MPKQKLSKHIVLCLYQAAAISSSGFSVFDADFSCIIANKWYDKGREKKP